MLENKEVLEQFKNSLTTTIKSIGKSNSIEVNFVKDSPSIDGKIINLIEPNLKSIRNNLNYIRAEADSKALKFRFHNDKMHQKDEKTQNNQFLNDWLKFCLAHGMATPDVLTSL